MGKASPNARPTLQFRAPQPELDSYRAAADSVGLTVSEWARTVLRREAGLWTGQRRTTMDSMTIISSRNDLRTWISDTRADLAALGEEYVSAVCDQVQHSDHPAWGADWSAWLSEEMDGLVTATVEGMDAIRPAPAYRVIVGEMGGEQGHVLELDGDEKDARNLLRKELRRYGGDGWGRIEVSHDGGENWERLDTLCS